MAPTSPSRGERRMPSSQAQRGLVQEREARSRSWISPGRRGRRCGPAGQQRRRRWRRRPASSSSVVACRSPARSCGPSRPSSTTFAIDGGRRHALAERLVQRSAPTFAPTSMPTSSSSVIGPTGKPKSVSAGRSPRSARLPRAGAPPRSCTGRGRAWCRSPARRAPRSRLAQLPAERRPRWRSPSRPSRGVTITSSSGILCDRREEVHARARCSGARCASAISPIGIDEVLDAKTHSSRGRRPPISASTWRLSSRSSNTASITRSARRKPRVVDAAGDAVHALARARAGRGCAASGARRARRARSAGRGPGPAATRPSAAPARPPPRPRLGDARAHEARAEHAELRHRRGGFVPFGIARVLLDLLVAKKTETSARETSETTSSPNAARLDLQALGQRAGGARSITSMAAQRRRVVAARLLEHGRARLAEDDAAGAGAPAQRDPGRAAAPGVPSARPSAALPRRRRAGRGAGTTSSTRPALGRARGLQRAAGEDQVERRPRGR